MTAAGWPAVLVDGDVRLRPLRRRDQDAWMALRAQSTPPGSSRGTRRARSRSRVRGRRSARSCAPWPRRRAPARRSRSPSTCAARSSGSSRSPRSPTARCAPRRSATGCPSTSPGLGITPTAVALATDHCFTALGLHRVEVNIRPENRSVAAGRREARVPRRGAAREVPAHPGPLVRPPHVRADRRGRARRAAGALARPRRRVRAAPGTGDAHRHAGALPGTRLVRRLPSVRERSRRTGRARAGRSCGWRTWCRTSCGTGNSCSSPGRTTGSPRRCAWSR